MGDIDVIVPCHNYGRFVPETLASLERQTLRPRRVVVLDDGSTDDSREVLRRLADQYDFELLTQPNRGLVPTLRRGIAMTSSELFVTVSADDTVREDFLELTHAALTADPDAAYCYTDMRKFGAVEERVQARPFDPAELYFLGNYIGGGALVRRAAYERTTGFRELGALEDWDLWLSFLDKRMVGTYLPEEVYEWRQHGPSRNGLSPRREWWNRHSIQARHPLLAVRYGGRLPHYVARKARLLRQR